MKSKNSYFEVRPIRRGHIERAHDILSDARNDDGSWDDDLMYDAYTHLKMAGMGEIIDA